MPADIINLQDWLTRQSPEAGDGSSPFIKIEVLKIQLIESIDALIIRCSKAESLYSSNTAAGARLVFQNLRKVIELTPSSSPLAANIYSDAGRAITKVCHMLADDLQAHSEDPPSPSDPPP